MPDFAGCWIGVEQVLEDSVVLITGGTGSFGKAMVKFLMNSECGEIRIFSRDEEKQEAMRNLFDDKRLRFYIGDVRDRASVDAAMKGVNHVFHAAALKQVPSCEFFPMEAVRTNIHGSSNVVESAIEFSVSSVVCLSTDKAVMPINTMGMTKAVMEKVVQAAARRLDSSDTRLCCVRYGNVMYSRGSVIPLFVDQIRRGVDLTVTDPDMTRFLLPLRDAVSLVEFAFQNGQQGDIFVKKAPACTVETLAKSVCEVMHSECRISSIGIRHGEKTYETLATAEELSRAEDMGDYFRIPMDARELNYSVFVTEGERDIKESDDYHSHNTTRLDQPAVRELLLSLPEIREALRNAESGQVSRQ